MATTMMIEQACRPDPAPPMRDRILDDAILNVPVHDANADQAERERASRAVRRLANTGRRGDQAFADEVAEWLDLPAGKLLTRWPVDADPAQMAACLAEARAGNGDTSTSLDAGDVDPTFQRVAVTDRLIVLCNRIAARVTATSHPSRIPAASEAAAKPHAHVLCTMAIAFARRCVGHVSATSVAPVFHSPPIPSPSTKRKKISTQMEVESPEPSEQSE